VTQKTISITLTALLISAALSLPVAAAPKKEAQPQSQKITVKTIGAISCETSSIEKNPDGSLKQCILTETKTIPVADVTCAPGLIKLNAEGIVSQCVLAVDRSYPDPLGIICDDGKIIELHPNGTPAKCTLAVEKKAPLLGAVCAANNVVAFYADGQLKQCVSTVEKKVPFANTKEVYITEFTCAKNSVIGFYPDGKVQQCTPTEHIYMRGKGTILPGEPVSLYPDGKVEEGTYTTPVYQNRSCKIENRASFHPNGSFKSCILPDDKHVGKAICKADAPVTYYPNGHVASCTLAAPVEKVKGTVIPAGTEVKFDEKNVIK
jgi:antitoxin component YwqK of YwqJK toxin-antitoxin module